MNKRVIIISIIVFFIVLIGTVSIVEFYYAKDSDKMPFFAIKTENKTKQYYKYSSIIYNVYKCYSGKVYAVSKNYEPVCDRVINYNEGYYININGLRISKKNYQAIYDISFKLDEIENFTDDSEVKDAVLIASEYERNLHKIIRTTKINKEIVNIVTFKELLENEYGDYSWTFIDDESYYKCEKEGLYKKYENGSCIGEWKNLSYSQNWCELSVKSHNLDIRSTYNKYCK